MAKSVTHVSGTKCHLSLRPLSHDAALRGRRFPRSVSPRCYSGTVRSPRFAGAATLLRGTMIDNPDQVERLVAKLRESLPLFATVNPEVAAVIREQAPEADTLRRYYITRVDYAGDEGGIVCKVELGPENDDRLSLPRLHTCGSVTQERSLVRSLRIRSTGSNVCGASVMVFAFDRRRGGIRQRSARDRNRIEPYAAFPLGRTFGRSMDSSAFIFASASSMIHICEL